MSDIKKIKNDYIQKLDEKLSLENINKIKSELFGKSGLISLEFKKLGSVSAVERKQFASELNNIKDELTEKINNKIKLIDEIKIDGDFVESQAFAYLAIRSFLKLPISFPNTTGCKKPCTGGVLVKNY